MNDPASDVKEMHFDTCRHCLVEMHPTLYCEDCVNDAQDEDPDDFQEEWRNYIIDTQEKRIEKLRRLLNRLESSIHKMSACFAGYREPESVDMWMRWANRWRGAVMELVK